MRSTLLVVVRIVASFICLPAALASPVSPAAPQTFDVLHYAARIEPDIAAGTVSGTVIVSLTATADGLRAVELDRGELTIDTVREGGVPLPAEPSGRHVVIQLSGAVARGDRRELEIEYHGTPRFGLELVPDRTQAYTIFSTSQWMVVVDAPQDRATLQLSVVLPPELVVAANGRRQARRALPGGKVEHEWRLDTPAPTYTFGFVAGSFNEVDEDHDGIGLRYLGDGFSDAELRNVFADTGAMIDFFAERAGVPYFGDLYTQALVVETVGQEMTGFSVMSEDFGRAVLAEPGGSSLAAHELAHQWWGNMVTCRDWTHFWLNEGFATFMAAAWEEQRFGRGRYESRIAASRERYERVRDAGGDRSLVFPDWNSPTSDDRTLVYQKGAYVLHLLREYLGDDVFWAGLRVYTRRHFGGSVTTADFQSAMEESSGRDLSAFFDEWVYLRR